MQLKAHKRRLKQSMRVFKHTSDSRQHVFHDRFPLTSNDCTGKRKHEQTQERKDPQVHKTDASIRIPKHAAHGTSTGSTFSHGLVFSPTGSSQMLMRLWGERNTRPLRRRRLLTELKALGSESHHGRQTYDYMSGLALLETKQQRRHEWQRGLTHGSSLYGGRSVPCEKNISEAKWRGKKVLAVFSAT